MNKKEPACKMTKDGLYQVSTSQIRRLEKDLKALKDEYDSLKIKQLTRHGIEQDAGKLKTEESTLNSLRKQIKNSENAIVEIKLEL